jgi:hypothetical protein
VIDRLKDISGESGKKDLPEDYEEWNVKDMKREDQMKFENH